MGPPRAERTAEGGRERGAVKEAAVPGVPAGAHSSRTRSRGRNRVAIRREAATDGVISPEQSAPRRTFRAPSLRGRPVPAPSGPVSSEVAATGRRGPREVVAAVPVDPTAVVPTVQGHHGGRCRRDLVVSASIGFRRGRRRVRHCPRHVNPKTVAPGVPRADPDPPRRDFRINDRP